jgi:hypothetical protein
MVPNGFRRKRTVTNDQVLKPILVGVSEQRRNKVEKGPYVPGSTNPFHTIRFRVRTWAEVNNRSMNSVVNSRKESGPKLNSQK